MTLYVPTNWNKAFVSLAASGRLGMIMGPGWWRSPLPGIPFALDNGAFGAWRDGVPWDESGWREMLRKTAESGSRPQWAIVPDVVADKAGTLRQWRKYLPEIQAMRWTAAIAVQDAMVPKDIPTEAQVIFVGGTTQWKWRTLPMWCASFPRVHVGRCGTSAWKLRRIEQLGAESCDGSGFLRETLNGRNGRQMLAWLHDPKPHPELNLCARPESTP